MVYDFLKQLYLKRSTLPPGFTTTELVIVLGITVILIALAVPVYGNLQVSARIDEKASQLIQIIRTAREYSLASYNNARHGVKFLPTKYILYQGSSYNQRDGQYDQEEELGSTLQLNLSLSGGVGEINFSKGLGMPNSVGIITLTHSSGGQKIISVNSLGMVEEK